MLFKREEQMKRKKEQDLSVINMKKACYLREKSR